MPECVWGALLSPRMRMEVWKPVTDRRDTPLGDLADKHGRVEMVSRTHSLAARKPSWPTSVLMISSWQSDSFDLLEYVQRMHIPTYEQTYTTSASSAEASDAMVEPLRALPTDLFHNLVQERSVQPSNKGDCS